MAKDQGDDGSSKVRSKWEFLQEPLPRHLQFEYLKLWQNEEDAFNLWVEFYYETERFDRTLPHIRTKNDGPVQLTDSESLQKSKGYADKVRHRLIQRVAGMTLDVLEDGKRRARVLPFKDLAFLRARQLGKEMDHLSYGEKICKVFDDLCERNADKGASPAEVTHEMAARGWLSPTDTVIDIEELMQGLRREGRL